MTLTTSLLGVVCRRRLGFDTVYLHTKFDGSSFSRSRDIIGVLKCKVGHVILTTPALRVISHPYASWDLTAYMRAKFDHSSFSLF